MQPEEALIILRRMAVEVARLDVQVGLEELRRDLPCLQQEPAKKRRESIMQKVMALSPRRAGFGITAIDDENGDIPTDPAVMARMLRRE